MSTRGRRCQRLLNSSTWGINCCYIMTNFFESIKQRVMKLLHIFILLFYQILDTANQGQRMKNMLFKKPISFMKLSFFPLLTLTASRITDWLPCCVKHICFSKGGF